MRKVFKSATKFIQSEGNSHLLNHSPKEAAGRPGDNTVKCTLSSANEAGLGAPVAAGVWGAVRWPAGAVAFVFVLVIVVLLSLLLLLFC